MSEPAKPPRLDGARRIAAAAAAAVLRKGALALAHGARTCLARARLDRDGGGR